MSEQQGQVVQQEWQVWSGCGWNRANDWWDASFWAQAEGRYAQLGAGFGREQQGRSGGAYSQSKVGFGRDS